MGVANSNPLFRHPYGRGETMRSQARELLRLRLDGSGALGSSQLAVN